MATLASVQTEAYIDVSQGARTPPEASPVPAIEPPSARTRAAGKRKAGSGAQQAAALGRVLPAITASTVSPAARSPPHSVATASVMADESSSKAARSKKLRKCPQSTKPTGLVDAVASRPADKPGEQPTMAAPHGCVTAGQQTATPASSALAALRAKRAGFASPTPSAGKIEAPPSTIGKRKTIAPTPARPAKALTERSKNIQTPSRSRPSVKQDSSKQDEARQNDVERTQGKLPPRRTGMFARTPISGPAPGLHRKEVKRKRSAEAEDHPTSSDEDVDVEKEKSRASSSPLATAQSANASRLVRSTPRTTYDVPSSPQTRPNNTVKRTQVAVGSGSWKKSITKKRDTRPKMTSHSVAASQKTTMPDLRTVPASTAETTLVPDSDIDHVSDAAPRSWSASENKLPSAREALKTRTPMAGETPNSTQRKLRSTEIAEQRTIPGGDMQGAVQKRKRPSPPPTLGTVTEKDQALGSVRLSSDQETAAVSEKPRWSAVKLQNQASAALDLSDAMGAVSSSPIIKRTVPNDDSTVTRPRAPPVAPLTPAALPSSPPIARMAIGPPSGGVNIDTVKRSTIISFDKSGPRNQGLRSAKGSSRGSAWTDRTSLPPVSKPLFSEARGTQAALTAKRANNPPPTAHSLNLMRTTATAPPCNVADTVSDALAGFLKKPEQAVSTPARVRETQKAKNETVRYSSPPHVDDDFQHIGDLEGSTLVDTGELSLEPQEPKFEKIASQRTASQLAMPPPASSRLDLAKLPTKMQTLAAVSSGQKQRVPVESTAGGKVSQLSAKRALENASATERQAKRKRIVPKADIHASVETGSHTSERQAGQNDDQEADKEVAAEASAVVSTKRVRSRIGRRDTQGTVDIGGSPVPKGYGIVNEDTTVLEDFACQRQIISSDRPTNTTPLERIAQTLDTQGNDHLGLVEYTLPPSCQPPRQSSNRKPKPAAPEEDSKAITGLALGTFNPHKMRIEDIAALPATAPSILSPGESGNHSTKSTQDRPRGKPPPFALFAEHRRPTVTKDNTREAKALPGLSGTRRHISISSSSSSDSEYPDQPDTDLDSDQSDAHAQSDLGSWRSGLAPHHTNLFDELVIVSHRLVRHLVDRETATRDIIDDYRRRGEYLVEQMERDEAFQFQEYKRDYEKRKKRLRKDLGRYRDELRVSVEAVERAREQRLRLAEQRAESDEKLRRLVEKFQ